MCLFWFNLWITVPLKSSLIALQYVHTYNVHVKLTECISYKTLPNQASLSNTTFFPLKGCVGNFVYDKTVQPNYKISWTHLISTNKLLQSVKLFCCYFL